MRVAARRLAAWVARMEPWLLIVLIPFLMFPNAVTPALVPLLLLPWLARKMAKGHFGERTPAGGAVVVLVAMLVVSIAVSPDIQRSTPKFYGIVLGVAAYYAIVNAVRREKDVWIVAGLLAAAGVAMSLLALVGTNWPVGKHTGLLLLARALPRLIGAAPGVLQRGFHPNEVGAALTLFIPLVVSLVLSTWRTSQPTSNPIRWLVLILLTLALVLMVGTLALTQSRSAWVGITIAVLLIIPLERRWTGRAPVLLVLSAATALTILGLRSIEPLIALLPEYSVPRVQIWQRALAMIRESPHTGIGLNAFPVVTAATDRWLPIASERLLELTHAHNVFLQVAVDMGMPGLVGYLAVLIAFGAAAYSVYRRSAPGPSRAICVGLVCAMLAYHVYGLTDCMTLGAKPGLALWAMWGLMAAMANLFSDADGRAPSGAHGEA